METILAERVASLEEEPGLPGDFTSRVMAARGFAPWEVRRPSAWRVPAAAAGLLLAASLVLALTPLFRLGPGTALVTWGELLLFSFARPAEALLSAGPLLAGAVTRAASLVPVSVMLTLLGLTVAAAAALFLSLSRRRGRGPQGTVRAGH